MNFLSARISVTFFALLLLVSCSASRDDAQAVKRFGWDATNEELEHYFSQFPDWENPLVFRVGTEAPRAHFFPYDSELAAKSNRRTDAENYLLLNGDWKFHWVSRPADKPTAFFDKTFDSTNWKSIPVTVKLGG